ncbi:MAG TPA: tryptophan--tRNA ligase [Candidatus Nanoperiomorbaceae bacterium]|nr:tryptophan--tRNA ligase [Candidatus Nanoperiomorbaceae bacterium]HMQ96844.1 tryptophan--tRNA ligase [Candidatus Nanoperiomorbaceae bacterium]HMR86459.1 tryptophan--tRNA ligase [Candidatus Nanoperiomorbaceae bacterium]HMU12026.1 tryptophan--tRNA ligase [Candidatus Nanoperiomorbaceae bacterium]
MKQVILTGIRANNDLHIGNYFGAMLPIIDMAKTHADEYQVNMFIPDLHSFTTPIEFGRPLHDAIINNARVFAAAGLPFDNDGINLYRQSHIAAHSELTWILDCFSGMGQLERMTQFKDKSAKLGNDQISVGLFNYPVLMAADILLYNATYVPVGEDQTQHLEFTRDIAGRINSRFGDILTVPASVKDQHKFFGKDQGLRIKDLLDPTKKMSKSDETGNGVIFLSDTPEAAKQKIMRATTDSLASVHYDKVSQPGIANLIDILALLRTTQPEQVAAEYEGMDRYGDFKQIVADEMAEFLAEFQKNLSSVDDEAVLAKLESSEAAMREQANETLLRVQKAVGLRV